MKTMNYLILMGLLIFGSSCTNYSPIGNNGEQEESETYFLELNFHQQALQNEDIKLRYDLLVIEEQLENGNNENQPEMEGILIRLAEIEESLAFNEEGLTFWGGIPGGGLPPVCEIDPVEFRPCPMPKAALTNLVLFNDEWAELWEEGLVYIHINDEEGNMVGEMVEMQPVEDTDGRFTRAIFEYDVESAFEMVVTKLNTRGEPRDTPYPLVD